jgi:chromosome segregation ATPase
MNRFLLLLVLVSGFLSGYLIGDYRSKDARETLAKAIETGKTLDAERESAISRLKTELDGVNEEHHREIEAIRQSHDSRLAEWRRSKDGLDDRIKRSNAKLAEADTRLRNLIALRDAASGTDKAGFDPEIARLRKERDDVRLEIEGSACLQARIPQSVSEALNITNAVEK